MSDERPPDDPDDRAAGPSDTDTDPTPSSDDSPAGEPTTNDARDQQADSGYGEERAPPEQREPAPETEPERTESTSGGGSNRAAFWISALIGLALAAGSIALVSGRAPFFEDILRIRPTVEGGGIGADWLVGNTMPVLDALIALVHFADVVMGIFILVMVFIHWAAFRRLGARMQPPGGTRTQEAATATDGGEPSKTRRSDGGAARDAANSQADDAPADGDSDGAENGGDRA